MAEAELRAELQAAEADLARLLEAGTGSAVVDAALERFVAESSDHRDRLNALVAQARPGSRP